MPWVIGAGRRTGASAAEVGAGGYRSLAAAGPIDSPARPRYFGEWHVRPAGVRSPGSRGSLLAGTRPRPGWPEGIGRPDLGKGHPAPARPRRDTRAAHHPGLGTESPYRGCPACRTAGPTAGLGAPRRTRPGRAPRRTQATRPARRPCSAGRWSGRRRSGWIARWPSVIAISWPGHSCNSAGPARPAESSGASSTMDPPRNPPGS